MKAPYPKELHLSHMIYPISLREKGYQPIPFTTGELPNETIYTATTDDGTLSFPLP